MKKSQYKRTNWRTLLLLPLLLSFLSAWGWLVHVQNAGTFLHKSFAVQFGDDFSSPLGTFSGIYDLQSSESYGGRVSYRERKWGFATFAYCSDKRVWTMTYSDSTSEINPCIYDVASSETSTFDIMDSFSTSWEIALQGQGRAVLQHLWSTSLDCRINQNVCGDHGTCSHNIGNSAERRVCICDEGWYGVQCNFMTPCENIEVDERKDGFLGTRIWSTHYHSLEFQDKTPASLYNRPIYVSEADSEYDIILFTGRRWMLASSRSLPNLQSTKTSNGNITTSLSEDTLAHYFTNDFHPYWSTWVSKFISEPVDIGTPKDTTAPIGLHWYNVETNDAVDSLSLDYSTEIQVSLICSTCNEKTNPCFFDGVCKANGSCQCKTGGKGTLCQVVPLKNGLCNTYFNTPAFQYDGGDCCRATCVPSDFLCGTNWNSDSKHFVYAGFPNCKDPNQICKTCWNQFSNVVQSQQTTNDRYSLKTGSGGKYMDFSDDGKTLAVSDGASSEGVQVYILSGYTWSKKGNLIRDTEESSYFGDSLSLSGDGRVVAIGGKVYSEGLGMVRVYEWHEFKWEQIGEKLIGSKAYSFFGASLSLSYNGKILAVGATGSANNLDSNVLSDVEGSVVIYEYNSINWQQRGNSIIIDKANSLGSVHTGQAVAVSSNGSIIAVGGRHTSKIQVHTWKGDHWKQVGADISPFGVDNACFGCALSISQDGMVVSIGAPKDDELLSEGGSVWVFFWDGNYWMQRGETLRGDRENTSFGHSVSLSSDGSLLAVGGDNHASDTLPAKVFLWNGLGEDAKWNKIGGFIPGGLSNEVKLSGDGSSIAVSLFNDDHVNILETILYKIFDNSNFKNRVLAPPEKTKLLVTKSVVINECKDESRDVLRITITPDPFLAETTWSLRDETKWSATSLISAGPYQSYGSTYSYKYCMNYETDCVRFTIFDAACNGFCTTSPCLGKFKLEWNGEIIAEKSKFGCQDSYMFGKLCDNYRG